MPKDTNLSRNASAKRRSKVSDQQNDHESRSLESHALGHGYSNGSQNPVVVLASSRDALQRLADIAQYLQSSFLSDIDVVEGDHGTDIDKENEIQRLNQAIETLTYSKSEEMENLKRELAGLKAGEEACRQETEKYKVMEAELQAEHAKAEEERKHEYDRKQQEDKIKAQKQMKVKRAEMEAEIKQKVRELENENQDLSVQNKQLKQDLSAAQDKLKTKKTRHALEREALEDKLEKRTLELEQLKSEFPVKGQPVQFYTQKFQDIFTVVKAVSSKYFQKLPERARTDPEAVHQALKKQNPIFESVSLSETESSNFLRARIAQHIISNCLCDHVWQSFFTRESNPNHQVLNQFLDGVSKSLSASGGRGESAWRVLTVQGIDALPDASVELREAEPTLQRILGMLGPLIAPEDSTKLEEDLVGVINASISLWKAARKDESKFVIAKHPDADNKENWHAEDIRIPEGASMAVEKVGFTAMKPLCLFPKILQITLRGELVIISRGSALFPNSHGWAQAILEKKEDDEELERVVREARSKVHARRTSCPTGPNSPTGLFQTQPLLS